MGRIIAALLIGIIAGAGGVFYFFVASPKNVPAPGVPISPPDGSGSPPGTAQIILKQDFFNDVLQSVFREMKAPSFPLTASGEPAPDTGACRSELTILPEGSGTQTSVRFENNTLSAPLAFSGSYSSMFGCMQFTGSARANMALRYDAGTQTVFGQVNVETVNLDGVNPIVGGVLTPLVQSTLNSRVNPVPIIDGRQISVSVPIAATGSNLNASVDDIRAEVKDNALFLYVIYEFHGSPVQN